MNELVTNIISSSVMGTLAAVAIILIKSVISKKLSSKAIMFIWIPVILKFLIPYIYQSDVSVYNNFPQQSLIYINESPVIPEQYISDIISLNLVPIIWSCGMVVATAVHIISYFKFKKSLHFLTCNSRKLKNASIIAKRKTNIKHNIRISVCKNEISPMIIGFAKPQVVIPRSVIQKFPQNQIEIILIHEFTHLQRKDRILNAVLVLVNCIHWFNPMVYFIVNLISKDMENACDESAISNLNNKDRYIYSKTLIDLAEIMSEIQSPVSVSPMANSKHSITSRIKRIYLSGKKKLNIAALPVCIMISTTLLTGAAESKTAPKIESFVNSIEPFVETKINIPEIGSAKNNDKSFKDDNSGKYTPNPVNPEQTTTGNTYEYFSEQDKPPISNGINYSKNKAVVPASGYVTSKTEIINSDNVTNQTDTSSEQTETEDKSFTENTGAEDTAIKNNNESKGNQSFHPQSSEKTYTYTGKNTTLKLSNDKSKSEFEYESDDLKIETVDISSASDEKIDGYFNIYRNGELIQSEVKASVSASPSSIYFNDEHSSDNDFSFNVHTKDIN